MSLHAQFIESFYQYHESQRGFRPTTFTGADCKAIKTIRERVLKIITEKTDENAIAMWQTILNKLPKVDKWLSEQPLQTINQRFDILIYKIKNERSTENQLARLSEWDGK